MPSRNAVLSDPRSGARPLGNSDPGPDKTIEPTRVYSSRGTIPDATRNAPAAPKAPARVSSPSRSSGGRSGPRRAPNLGRTAQQFSSPEFSNYQGIILAEFVLAELLVSATPVVTNKKDASTGQFLSPYVGQDMVKMLSIGMLYFLLQLSTVFSGKAGRFAAWFGGLILLVVGLNEANNIVKILNIFSGVGTAAKATASDAITNATAPFSGVGGPQNVPTSSASLPEGTVAGQHGR